MYIEQIYAIESYLSNMLLAKYAFDAGMTDLSKITLLTYDEYSGGDSGYFENFVTILEYFFPEVEYQLAYEDEDFEKKEEWLLSAGITNSLIDPYVLIRLQDSSLTAQSTNLIHSSLFENEFAEVISIDGGVLLVVDMDYGLPEFTEILDYLIG